MSDSQGAPPEVAGEMEKPPPYTQATDQTGAPPSAGYPTQPQPSAGYPTQPPPAAGYPTQPQPSAGYPTQPPPAAGYPTQPPPSAGYPTQPPPAAGYPAQPPPAAGYPMQPPPAAGYAPQPQVADPTNVVIVSQPGIVIHHNLAFRDAPVACACPNCHNQVTSNVQREIGGLTLLIMGALCIFGLWFFCCLIPLCIDACKDAVHTCPVCNHQLARWTQL